MSRRVRLDEGLFVAVDSQGYVRNGHGSCGPKLYIHESTAVRRAGPGGSVYRLSSGIAGPFLQRVHGTGAGVFHATRSLP